MFYRTTRAAQKLTCSAAVYEKLFSILHVI